MQPVQVPAPRGGVMDVLHVLAVLGWVVEMAKWEHGCGVGLCGERQRQRCGRVVVVAVGATLVHARLTFDN